MNKIKRKDSLNKLCEPSMPETVQPHSNLQVQFQTIMIRICKNTDSSASRFL